MITKTEKGLLKTVLLLNRIRSVWQETVSTQAWHQLSAAGQEQRQNNGRNIDSEILRSDLSYTCLGEMNIILN
jgi:hypothetical protein